MSIINYIYDNLRCAFLDVFMPFITLFGESGIFFICLAVVLMIFKRTRKTGFTLSVSLIIGLICCNMVLKPMVARPRPYTIREDVVLLVERLYDYSFPSGHTTAAFEAATVMYIRNRKFGTCFILLAILIAFSRLYLFVHYPTDVLVGILLGIVSGIVSAKIIDVLYDKYEAKKLNV